MSQQVRMVGRQACPVSHQPAWIRSRQRSRSNWSKLVATRASRSTSGSSGLTARHPVSRPSAASNVLVSPKRMPCLAQSAGASRVRPVETSSTSSYALKRSTM